MPEILRTLWPHLLALFTVSVDIAASCHAVLYKRDSRSAIGWVGFIWFVPIIGGLLYVWLGINRVQRHAKALRQPASLPRPCDGEHVLPPEAEAVRGVGERFAHLAKLVGQVTQYPLTGGNRIEILDRTTAYPQMLAAIEEARSSITLTTYIFDNDPAGQWFLEALARAVKRGVLVRVIIDDVGAKYSWPSIVRPLRRAGVPVAEFMPKLTPWALRYANLRNHRKILVVDGQLGFTGGMNIRAGHSAQCTSAEPIEDRHFRVEGPVIQQLQHTFAEDWFFCRGERLEGEPWFVPLAPVGNTLARGIPDGPDEDFDNLKTTLLAALACAASSVHIVTPYFLPDASLITALNLAAMRGVQVDIILPSVNNLRLVQWASTAAYWQVLERGCRIWLSPPPFDHGKLMVVDGAWSLIGSSNWDPRSLRLNFEFNVECYDRPLAAALDKQFREKLKTARQISLEEVDSRSLPIRLRDGIARLASPYL
ncbi:MAG: PLDc N-terminal domain-containing protein [Planctomyces sp.]|nr:PLDc N-terminal domain-containing protein [Planctomyces sp.]